MELPGDTDIKDRHGPRAGTSRFSAHPRWGRGRVKGPGQREGGSLLPRAKRVLSPNSPSSTLSKVPPLPWRAHLPAPNPDAGTTPLQPPRAGAAPSPLPGEAQSFLLFTPTASQRASRGGRGQRWFILGPETEPEHTLGATGLGKGDAKAGKGLQHLLCLLEGQVPASSPAPSRRAQRSC